MFPSIDNKNCYNFKLDEDFSLWLNYCKMIL